MGSILGGDQNPTGVVVRAAFYRGTRPGIAGFYNIAVRAVTKGIYSHCELVFSDGQCASSSFLDNGVRFKRIDFDPEHWDFVELPDELEAGAREWFEKHNHQRYDILGNIRFILWPIAEEKDKWFCSEAMAKSFGLMQAWRYDANVLYSALKLLESRSCKQNLKKS